MSRRTVRIRFSKLGKIRFTSHRDVARVWERALRRATIPVAYTEGFSPHPRLSFGLALSTSYESLGEYLDVDLNDSFTVDVEDLPARLNPCLPVGLDVQAAAEIEPGTLTPGVSSPRTRLSLQQAVTSCSWRIEVTGLDPVELAERVDGLLAADQLVVTRERKGQPVTDDVRPALLSLSVTGTQLETELATQPRGFRPSELIGLFGEGADEGRVCRLHQWITADGARREPLPLASRDPRGGIAPDHAATSAPHAELRAS